MNFTDLKHFKAFLLSFPDNPYEKIEISDREEQFILCIFAPEKH